MTARVFVGISLICSVLARLQVLPSHQSLCQDYSLMHRSTTQAIRRHSGDLIQEFMPGSSS